MAANGVMVTGSNVIDSNNFSVGVTAWPHVAVAAWLTCVSVLLMT